MPKEEREETHEAKQELNIANKQPGPSEPARSRQRACGWTPATTPRQTPARSTHIKYVARLFVLKTVT